MTLGRSVLTPRARLFGWLWLASVAGCHDAAPASDVPPTEAGPCATAPRDRFAAEPRAHDVLTQHNDVARTGATLTETALDTCTASALVQVGEFPVDGEIYAQPLYAGGVSSALGEKNLLVVATLANSLYAFDADLPGSEAVWQLGREGELGAPAFSSRNISGMNGILATPVIDRESGSVFVVARDCDPAYPPAAPRCQQRLFAIELATGKILQSVAVAGSADNAQADSPTFFDPSLHWARAALLLHQGRLFVSFGSGPNGNAHEEDFPFHGWLFGYSASDLTLAPSVYCSTPDFGGGAIWQSGNGPAADDRALYFATGNGIHQPTPVAPAGFPKQPEGDEDSLVRVPLAEPARSSRYWDARPYHSDGNVFQYMEKNDIDLSTAGPLLIPDSSQLVVSGKSGIVYLLNRDDLSLGQDPLEVFHAPALPAGQSKYIYFYDGGPHVHGSPAFIRPNEESGAPGLGLIFLWPAHERLKSFNYDYSSGLLAELATSDLPELESGGTLSISADGPRPESAILWASAVDADGVSGHLWALSATTLTRLWDAKLPAWAKFAVPTVAAGRVYLASSSNQPESKPAVLAFGLAP